MSFGLHESCLSWIEGIGCLAVAQEVSIVAAEAKRASDLLAAGLQKAPEAGVGQVTCGACAIHVPCRPTVHCEKHCC